MIFKIVLYVKYFEVGVKMVDFYGWEMLINYGL